MEGERAEGALQQFCMICDLSLKLKCSSAPPRNGNSHRGERKFVRENKWKVLFHRSLSEFGLWIVRGSRSA